MSNSEGNFDDFGMDTITLAGPLKAKLDAIKGAGFTQVMLLARDLVGHPQGWRAAVQEVKDSGLRVTGFQVLRDFEGLSGHLHDYKIDIAKSMLEMCHALGCGVMLACSSTSTHASGDTETIVKDLRKRGITSKSWTTSKGVERQGKLITKGAVYKIFSNPVYIGIAAYKGQHFPGEHEGIITQELWDTVQTHLKNGTPMNKARLAGRGSAPSLLRGLLFSEQGRAFTPGWTRKQHKTYRYYINTDAIKLGKESCEVRRVPAGEIEGVVIEQLRGVLRAPEILAAAVREVTLSRPDISEADAEQHQGRHDIKADEDQPERSAEQALPAHGEPDGEDPVEGDGDPAHPAQAVLAERRHDGDVSRDARDAEQMIEDHRDCFHASFPGMASSTRTMTIPPTA